MKATLTLFALALLAATASLNAADKKPNILIIVADDLGYGELSAQGNPQIPTPRIDSLAQNGVRFTSGYVTGPYCSPTRAALQTGRYQQRFGHEFNPGPTSPNAGLSLNETTIGNRLKAQGYATAWFGKSHLGFLPEYHPLKRGYDEYFGFLGGMHDYLDAAGDAHNPILRGTNVVNNIDYTTDAFGRETVQFIEKHKAEPWFVYLAFNAVHAPLESTEKYLARFPNLEPRKRHTFAAMLSAMDDAVGSVLAKIHELGQDEDTLIFFFSDNGGPTPSTTSGNGPLRGFKAQTWEGGVRIPYMVQWKGHLPAGKVDDRLVCQMDILPTALAASGAEIKPEWKLDGVNLLPYLSGAKSGSPHKSIFWRFGGQMAVRQGDWKLVKAPGLAAGQKALQGKANTENAELYNLASDIGEKDNLAAKEPAKVKELAAAWNAWNSEMVDPLWGPGSALAKNAAKSSASPEGPWKSGDVLAATDAPQFAKHTFTVSAEIEAAGDSGVIIAHGGQTRGYSVYLKGGKLVFGVRIAKKLHEAVAAEALGKGPHKLEAKLAADGGMVLLVDGKQVADTQAPGLITNQPARGLSVGDDDGSVGDYSGATKFTGRIENVKVVVLP